MDRFQAFKEAQLVYNGNANAIVRFAGSKNLQRCCVRFKSLDLNNKYTRENAEYIERQVLPLLSGAVIPPQLSILSLNDVRQVLQSFVPKLDVNEVLALEMPDLSLGMDERRALDHFTLIHNSKDKSEVLWEFKPKWLSYAKSADSPCRNCTLNRVKGRDIPYCYDAYLRDPKRLSQYFRCHQLPERFIRDIEAYLHQDSNVLVQLAKVQDDIGKRSPPLCNVGCESDVTAELALLMTLRDVSCFVRWQENGNISATIVDVDLKPKSKWQHWVTEHRKVHEYAQKVFH